MYTLRRVASTCPSDSILEALSRGERVDESIAGHVSTCPHCQARFTHFAIARTVATPRVKRHTVIEHGLDDTHVSTETKLSEVKGSKNEKTTISGVTRGEALDRYVILDRLGAGGMGEVYAAWDPVLDRKVAVKVLRGDFESTGMGDELKTRLFREAQSLAKLSHPNVVTVHDVGIAQERVYLAMEFVEGKTLKGWLESKPSWQQIIDVFLAAGEGLAAAHEQGITHRDFKHDNVLVSTDGRVRVMDFGLAHGQAAPKTKTSDSGLQRSITQPGAMLGTPAYMSPEAMHGRQTDFRSDEFSFCVSLFEALYGYRPFEGTTPAGLLIEVEANRVRAIPRDSKVPRRIHQLLLKGLRADPAERFQTMRALLVQLGRRKTTRNRGRLIAVGIVALLISSAATGLAIHRVRTRCAGFETRLEDVWGVPTKRKVKLAFEASGKPWSATAFKDVETRLDAYASTWLQLRTAACEGTGGKSDEELGQEILCLSRRLNDLGATTQLFSRSDPEIVERAVTTASSLPPLAACEVTRPATRPHEETDEPLHAQLSLVRALIDAGKYAEAATSAFEIASRADVVGDKSAWAESRLLAAIAKVRTGDPRSADTLIEESILGAETARDDQLQARGWVERVGFAALNGAPPDADRWARFARAALDRVDSPPELEASLANNLGVLAYYRGQYAQAVEAHQKALVLRRQIFGERHPLVARSHSNLGIAYRQLGRLDEARAEYEQALTIEEAVLDPSHPQVADTLNNLGNVLQAQQAPTAARRALERSLRIKEVAYGTDSLPVAVTLTNLGALYLDLHDVPEADRALTRAVAIKEQRAGPETVTVAISLTNLAQARRAEKRWKESIAADERALAIRAKKQGEAHADLAYNLTGLGEAKLLDGDRVGATRALERALTLRPTRGAERGYTAFWLARALEKSKDPRCAALLEEAIADVPLPSPIPDEARAALAAKPRR